MFRHAFTRGGWWFLGTVFVAWLLGGPNGIGVIEDVDYSLQEQLSFPIIVGIIVGVWVTFKTWHDALDDKDK